MPALLPPGAEPDEGARMDPVPALGAHNAAILAEIGLSATEIEQLHADGLPERVRAHLQAQLPAYITAGERGAGFAEVAAAILESRTGG